MLRLIVPVAAVSVLLSSAAASGAETRTARDLVGTWTLVSTVAQQGGTKTDMFGPDPSGTLVFGSDGHYALIFLRRDLPKVASDSRTSATPDESRAIAQGEHRPLRHVHGGRDGRGPGPPDRGQHLPELGRRRAAAGVLAFRGRADLHLPRLDRRGHPGDDAPRQVGTRTDRPR